jgi:hypothetical protein
MTLNMPRFLILLLLAIAGNFTFGAESLTNSLSKIELTFISGSLPATTRAALTDRRYDPPQRYILKVGETVNGITVTRIDLENNVVEVALAGKTNIVGFPARKKK